jgi:hypothetical protein
LLKGAVAKKGKGEENKYILGGLVGNEVEKKNKK